MAKANSKTTTKTTNSNSKSTKSSYYMPPSYYESIRSAKGKGKNKTNREDIPDY